MTLHVIMNLTVSRVFVWFGDALVCLCVSARGGEGDVPESIHRIEKLLDTSIEFHELDLLDQPGLEKLFKKVRKLIQVIYLKKKLLGKCW